MEAFPIARAPSTAARPGSVAREKTCLASGVCRMAGSRIIIDVIASGPSVTP
jgi:hypothetical protein